MMKLFFHRFRQPAVGATLLLTLFLLSCQTKVGAPTTAESVAPPTPSVAPTAGVTTQFDPVDPSATLTAPLSSLPLTEPDTVELSTALSSTTFPLPATEPETTPSATETDSPIETQPLPQTSTVITTDLGEPDTEEPASSPYVALSCYTDYILLYDATEGEILYTTGGEQQIYPASTTKLLVLRYALTMVDESSLFTVGNEINLVPGDSSKAGIRKGECYTCTDMVAAILLPSGNDAAYTVAAHCGRILAGDDSLSATDAVARFMEGLNQYAADLGLTGTHFVTPDGYHDPEHVTTLNDMLKIVLHAKEHPLIARMMGTYSYRVTDLANGRSQTWKNTNSLLQSGSRYYYRYAASGKTGYHSAAGACLVATAVKDGRELVVLLFKCSDKQLRFTDAVNFFELGFSLQGSA